MSKVKELADTWYKSLGFSKAIFNPVYDFYWSLTKKESIIIMHCDDANYKEYLLTQSELKSELTELIQKLDREYARYVDKNTAIIFIVKGLDQLKELDDYVDVDTQNIDDLQKAIDVYQKNLYFFLKKVVVIDDSEIGDSEFEDAKEVIENTLDIVKLASNIKNDAILKLISNFGYFRVELDSEFKSDFRIGSKNKYEREKYYNIKMESLYETRELLKSKDEIEIYKKGVFTLEKTDEKVNIYRVLFEKYGNYRGLVSYENSTKELRSDVFKFLVYSMGYYDEIKYSECLYEMNNDENVNLHSSLIISFFLTDLIVKFGYESNRPIVLLNFLDIDFPSQGKAVSILRELNLSQVVFLSFGEEENSYLLYKISK